MAVPGSRQSSQETEEAEAGMMLNLKILETWRCLLWELWLWADTQNGCPQGPKGPPGLAAWEKTCYTAHFGLCEPEVT